MRKWAERARTSSTTRNALRFQVSAAWLRLDHELIDLAQAVDWTSEFPQCLSSDLRVS